MAAEAAKESSLWAAALRPVGARKRVAVFSPLAPAGLAFGLETVYEAYIVHYGTSRLFDAADEGERVLLGDYLYAHGLVRIAQTGGVDAVVVMAELISRCASLRAAGASGDGDAWVDAMRALGGEPAAEAVTAALRLHTETCRS